MKKVPYPTLLHHCKTCEMCSLLLMQGYALPSLQREIQDSHQKNNPNQLNRYDNFPLLVHRGSGR
jgi:hypothetical protein